MMSFLLNWSTRLVANTFTALRAAGFALLRAAALKHVLLAARAIVQRMLVSSDTASSRLIL